MMTTNNDNDNSNGRHSAERRAGIGDLLGISEVSGGGFDPVHEMFEAPDEFSLLAARARVSAKEIADYLVIFGRRQRLKSAHTDIVDLIGKKLQLSIGLNGQARKETVQMYTGGLAARNPVPFAIPNVVDKMRSNGASDRGGVQS